MAGAGTAPLAGYRLAPGRREITFGRQRTRRIRSGGHAKALVRVMLAFRARGHPRRTAPGISAAAATIVVWSNERGAVHRVERKTIRPGRGHSTARDSLQAVERKVHELSEEEVLALDSAEFGSAVAAQVMLTPPRVDIARARLTDRGERGRLHVRRRRRVQQQRNRRAIMHKGRRLRVEVPVSGEASLLGGRPAAGSAPSQASCRTA